MYYWRDTRLELGAAGGEDHRRCLVTFQLDAQYNTTALYDSFSLILRAKTIFLLIIIKLVGNQ